MPFNPRGSFSLDLSLFGSWVQDNSPTDLPAGASPDYSFCFFLPGGIYTRPALVAATPSPLAGNPPIASVKDFQLPNGDSLTIELDGNGVLWTNDSAATSDTVAIGTTTPGLQFKAETAFRKQWYAFFGNAQSEFFTENPFVGVDVPLYYNGKILQRVTLDAPGIPPTMANVSTEAIPLAISASSGTLTVTAARTTTPDAHGQYHVMIYTCSGAVPVNWLNSSIVVTGLSGTNSSVANRTGNIYYISGNQFYMSIVSGLSVNLTGQSGTATNGSSGAGNYMVRNGNIATAYIGNSVPLYYIKAGFWASIMNVDGTFVKDAGWTITNIVRDTTGLVTVTISTQLTNLPSGAVLNIAATDATDFPVGPQTVYTVIASAPGTTIFTYTSLDVTAAASTAGGTVNQTWSPQGGTFANAAQILSVGLDPVSGYYVTFFQLGPDAVLNSTGYSGEPVLQVQAQAAPGQRQAVLIFASQDGALTAPSIPVSFSTLGAGNLMVAQNIALGPPGTVQRIIAFTPSAGSSFYYIDPSILKQVGGLAPVLATGTIINDNFTTSAVIDFSDTELTSSTQIDIEGNDLFNQIVLAPCLGNIEYNGRMCWWGEINNIKNLINMGFDGGYLPPSGVCDVSPSYGAGAVDWVSGAQFEFVWAGSTIVINGQQYLVTAVISPTQLYVAGTFSSPETYAFSMLDALGTAPLGWDTSAGDGLGYLTPFPDTSDVPGFSYVMPAGSNSMIQQSFYQDYYGGPIGTPNTRYIFRLKAFIPPGVGDNIAAQIYSPSLGVLASVSIFVAAEVSTWYSFNFTNATPASLPSDVMLRVLLAPDSPSNCTIDDIEIIYADEPVSYDQMRLSYYQNPFGYDDITGIISVDPSENLAGAFRQRGYLYILGDTSLFQSIDNGTGEPSSWDVTQYASNCGCSGPCAVDSTEDEGIWIGRYGCRVFDGASIPKKISQAWATTFESINWDVQTVMWVKNDPVNRLLYFGIPTGEWLTPNLTIQMSYRLNDAAYNVPDEIHISAYTGKMIDTDLTRRWSPWNRSLNCADMCTRPLLSGQDGVARTIVFGGGNGQQLGSGTSYGNIYVLDTWNYFPLNPSLGTWNCSDADYGTIPMYYTTYFFFTHDLEQQPLIGQFRKLFNFVAVHALGIGSLKITPLIDAMQNAGTPFPMPPLSLTDPGYDLEFHPVIKGNRVAFRLEPYVSEGTSKALALTHMIVSARKDMVFPIRGTIFGG